MTFDHIVGKLGGYLRENEVRETAEELNASIVSFVLIWRLCIDQARHDISDRFGKDSQQLSNFTLATKQAYDEHFGYRLVEGLRNYVAHRAMPPISGNIQQSRGTQPNEVVITPTITLSKTPLLESGKMPKILKQDLEDHPEERIPLPEAIDDAMSGFQKITDALFEIDRPQLEEHLMRLRDLVLETQPEVPALMEYTKSTTGVRQISGFTRFDDLFWLLGIQQEPLGPPRRRAASTTATESPDGGEQTQDSPIAPQDGPNTTS
ncbi:hypothetical protein [Amycolatopsis sp. NPDC003861]